MSLVTVVIKRVQKFPAPPFLKQETKCIGVWEEILEESRRNFP